MGTLSNLTFGLFDPKPANAQSSSDFMSAGPKPTAVPAPGVSFTPQGQPNTPYVYNLPGGNQGSTPYYAKPAVQTSNNLGVGSNAPSMSLSSGSSGGNNDLIQQYKNSGWTDENAIKADIAATGGSKFSGGGNGGGSSFKVDVSKTGSLLSSGTPSSDMEGYFGQLKAAAEAGDQAAMDQLNQVYGQQEETLNKQYGQADTDKAQAEKELALQLQNTETDISTQKTKAQESVMSESEKAAEAARSAQRQNRNIMRALGVLGSTYAAEALQNPMNELAKQKATFAKWGMDQVATLDQNLNKFKSEINLQKDKILSQYATIKQKISDDIRYTQQQKATSLQALKAGAQQNLAQIEGQRISYAQQLDQQKLAMAQQIAQILLNKNPNADIGAIMAQAKQTTGQMFPASQQVATVGATPGRNTLSGFNMQNYVGWNPQAAQEDYKKKQGLA